MGGKGGGGGAGAALLPDVTPEPGFSGPGVPRRRKQTSCFFSEDVSSCQSQMVQPAWAEQAEQQSSALLTFFSLAMSGGDDCSSPGLKALGSQIREGRAAAAAKKAAIQ